MGTTIKLNDLKVGDVVLYPPHEGDWLAQAIALLTSGTVNHAAIYYGVKDGKHCVVESVLAGMNINPMPDSIEDLYALPIMRHKNKSDLQPVIDCAQKYINENNPYPYVNLGILALLLINKSFTKATLKSLVIYNITLLLSVKLMKAIQALRPGQHPMSCSQFTAQCFTDAGEDYNLKFDKLIVQLDKILQCNALDIEKTSLLDILEIAEPEPMLMATVNDMQAQEVLENEDLIVADFISLLNSETANQPLLMVSKLETANRPIAPIIKKIVFALYEMITGKQTDQIQEAIDGIKFSTNRNFLVTPEDININCNNLEHVGKLAY